jgi:hypothetical protein
MDQVKRGNRLVTSRLACLCAMQNCWPWPECPARSVPLPGLPQSVLQPFEPIHPIPFSTHCQPYHIPMYLLCPRVVPTLF